MRGLMFMMMALAATGGTVPYPGDAAFSPPPPPPPPRRPGRAERGPLAVACPRCKAEPGKGCDRRTLGAHHVHRDRVQLAQQRLRELRESGAPDLWPK